MRSSQNPETDAIPSSVRALDRILNRRVADASTDADQLAALRLKTQLKRRIVALDDDEIDAAAARLLQQLAGAAPSVPSDGSRGTAT